MTDDQKNEVLERHVRELAEIFDSVQILASTLNSDTTTSCHKRGSGNWYARQGMAHEFIQLSIAEDAAVKIAEKLDGEEE